MLKNASIVNEIVDNENFRIEILKNEMLSHK